MTILVVDTTKNLNEAFMTPKLLSCLEQKRVSYLVASTRTDVNGMLDQHAHRITGIILSGGPLCLSEELTISLINKNIAVLLRRQSVPLLGICFGFQLLVASFGGKIVSMDKQAHGIRQIKILSKISPILKHLNTEYLQVYQSHKDKVKEVPPNFKVIATDDHDVIQGIENEHFSIWGVQFHPEGLASTAQILYNFLDICKAQTKKNAQN